jgi:hypothetical protein
MFIADGHPSFRSNARFETKRTIEARKKINQRARGSEMTGDNEERET